MKQLLLSKLPALFAALAAEQKLYIPADDAAGQANFTLWREGLQLTKKLNTVCSAKDLFFPQVENLVGFRVTGKQLDLVETRDPAEPFVLFGVRACDARSFAILDRVFLSEPQDTYYAARRAHGTVVTLACTRPEETCFCQAFGVDPAQPQGDVSCWMDAAALYWQANTEKGEALTAKLSMLEDAGDEAVKAQQAQTRAILKKLPLASLDLSAVGAGKTKALFDRPEWKRSRKAASAAARAPSSARPASATTSRNSTPASSSAASAAGTAACTRTSPRCPPVSRARPSSSASASVLCTSWSISRITTTGSSAASAAAGAWRSARST